MKRPSNAPPLPEDEIDRPQDLHLAHLNSLVDSGDIRLAGPIDLDFDTSLPGMRLYHTGSLARARECATADPAVAAGRLEIDAMYFSCPEGSLSTRPT